VTDPSSESPLESSSRGVMVLAGIGAPELQAWVHGADGLPYRVDFLWRDKRVTGEADGWVKYRDIDDVRAEKRREDALRQARDSSSSGGRGTSYVVIRSASWPGCASRSTPDTAHLSVASRVI